MQAWIYGFLFPFVMDVASATLLRTRSNTFGPLSELAGSTFAVDSITSPGQTRTIPVQSVNVVPSQRNVAASQQVQGSSSATCAVSFTPEVTNNNNQQSNPGLRDPNIPNQRNPSLPATRMKKRDLFKQISLSDDESSSLFMTDVAENCVTAMRRAVIQDGGNVPSGLVTCYSLGYVDPATSTFGAYLSVFRLGNLAEAEGISGISLDELSRSGRLEMGFKSDDSHSDSKTQTGNEFYQSTKPGTFNFNHPPIAPSDDPDHLINPTNPHFTAHCLGKEMILIGTFHINLIQPQVTQSTSMFEKRDNQPLKSFLSPSGIRLVVRDMQMQMPVKLLDLTHQISKRSTSFRASSWGLFKRSSPTPLNKRAEFFSDSACVESGLALNPFFTAPQATQQNSTIPISNGLSFIAGVNPQTTPTTPNPNSTPLSRTSTNQTDLPINTPPIPSSFITVNSGQPPATASSQSQLRTSGAESVGEETTAFQLPGRKLMVLPIGLAIFGAVSTITLIIVGIVTYERLKYRKQFRRRKMEQDMSQARA